MFLCHSSGDKPEVRSLYQRLKGEPGISPWQDVEKLLPGQDWDAEIRLAVRASGAVVVCLSQASVTKTGYVQKEIVFALDAAAERPERAIFPDPAAAGGVRRPYPLEPSAARGLLRPFRLYQVGAGATGRGRVTSKPRAKPTRKKASA